MNPEFWLKKIPECIDAIKGNQQEIIVELLQSLAAENDEDPLYQFILGYLIIECPAYINCSENRDEISCNYLISAGKEHFMAADKFLIDRFLCSNLINAGHYEACAERLRASRYLGGLFYEGYVYELNDFLKDLDCSYRMYRVSAYRGYPEAFFRLGWFYSQGIVVEPDQEKAAKYFYIAAKAGVALGCQNFGVRLKQGNGVQEDKLLARDYFRLGAEFKNDICFNQYGLTLSDEEFGLIDEKASFDNFEKSAMAFYDMALGNLARCYLIGFGVDQDLTRAYAIADFARKVEEPEGTQIAEHLEHEISSSDKKDAEAFQQSFWQKSIEYQHQLAVEELVDRLEEMRNFVQTPWEDRHLIEVPNDLHERDFIRPDLLENFPY